MNDVDGLRPAPDRSRTIDGIRGIAALSVLCYHVWLYRVGSPPGARTALTDKVFFQFNLGLVCFFVLSGYLLYRPFVRAALSRQSPVGLRDYASRRARRIVPAYYACIGGCLLLYWAVGYSASTPPASRLPMFALFAQNYSLTTVMKINPVTWTLGVEVAFYLALPLIGALAFLLGRRLRLAPHVLLLVGLLAVTVGWNALVHFKGWNTLASKALPAYIGHFACGMLVALWAERRRARLGAGATLGRSATAVLFAAGAATVVASAYWHETSASFTLAGALLTTLPAAIGFAGVIAAAAIGSGFSVRWLGTRALAGVGVISYGVYLWHLPLLLVTRRLGLLTSLMIPRLAIVLAVTLPVAWLSWTRLERPLIKRGSRTREVAIRSPAPALARD